MASNKIGRNERCPCGSGKKYKNCCEGKSSRLTPANWATIAAIVLAVGVLVYFVVNAARSDGPSAARTCPPGQVWSPQHGHCH